MNGYKLEAEDAITVVDKLVNADLIAATSTEELATAFQYSAAFANTAGVSIDKMIGLLTTASETTRLSGETVGQAFKSIFSRLQNVKAGKNVDDEGESINDSEKTLKKYNITLRESTTEFRSMEDVLDEVGRRWQEFDSVEKAQIATAISGVHQRNTFIAVMDNYDKVLKYTNETMNASGTTAEKYQHYMDSLEATINELQVQWEQFIQELNATDTFKNAIKFVSGLLSVLDALVNKAPILQALLGAFIGFKGVKGVVSSILKMASAISKFKGLGNPIKTLANSFKSLKISSYALSGMYEELEQKLSIYQKQQIMQIMTNKELTMEQKKQHLANLQLNASTIELITSDNLLAPTLSSLTAQYDEATAAKIMATLSSESLTDAQKIEQIAAALVTFGLGAEAAETAKLIVQQNALKVSTQGATVAMTALKMALGLVSAAVTVIISGVMSHQQEQEKLRDNAIDAANAYNEQAISMEELMEKYKSLRKELSNTQDLDSQKEITSEILDIRSQVIDSYGSEAEKIDFINGQLNETLDLWQHINQEKARETYTDNKNEYQKTLEYATSKGFWNYSDVLAGKTHGYATDIAGVDTDTTLGLWKIGRGDVPQSQDQVGLFTKYYSFRGATVFETYDKLVELSTQIQDALEDSQKYGLKENEIEGLANLQKNIITEINAYDKDENFTKNKQLFETAQQSVIDAMGAGAIYDAYTEAISQLNILSANYDVNNQDEINKLQTDIGTYQQELQDLYDSTSDETQRGYLDVVMGALSEEEQKVSKGLSAKKYISEQLSENDDLLDKIKKMTTEELAASATLQDTPISQAFQTLKTNLKDNEGIVMSVEEIAQAVSDLGYTYKETEKITAASLIENFSTDESEIKTITENIEKLNNVVKAASSGETIDLEELSALRDVGIDVSNIVAGGLDNVVEISKVRDDYIQSQINSLEEQIALNNQIMSQDSDITESEKQQIEFENQMIQLRIKVIKSATNAIKSNSNEYIESLKSANEIISQLVAYGETRIGEDILSDITDQYADMSGYVEKYRLGMIDNKELLETFRKFYQNDIKNYTAYQKEKYVNTTEYFEVWKKNNSDWVNKFKETYKIDLNNATNYTTAKSMILKDNMSKYIDSTTGELTSAGEYAVTHISGGYEAALAYKIKETQRAFNALMDKINKDTKEYTPTIDMTDVYNGSIDEVVSRIKSAYSVINDLKENSNKVTMGTLDSMKDAYEGMGEYVNQYLAGKIDTTELLNKFNEFYAKDKDLYIYYQTQKLETDADMYSKFMNNSGVWIKKLRGDYKKDLANVSTYAEAKELILENLSNSSLNLASALDLNFWETGEINQEVKDILSSFAQGVNSGYDAQIYSKAQNALNDLSILVKEWTNWAEDDIGGLFNNLDDLLKDSTYSVEDALSDISSILSNEVDYWEQITNGIVAAAQLEIDALDKEIDLLEKKNEEQQRQIDLQEKLEALNRAKTQRSVREYNAETGQFEWTTNKKDIETAQREYDEALKEDEIKSKEAAKEWIEKYGESFSSVSSTIESQRQINKAIQALADIRGVKASDLTYKDLLNMTEKEQSTIRNKYGSAVDMNLAFEEAQKQQDINKAKTNLVTGGYATNGANGFVLDYNALSNAIGVPFTKLASSLSGYTEILKSTSFAETKPTTSTVNNVTNTGAVTNSYVLSGDMTFKFDGNMDVDGFITQLATKLDEKIAITPLP